MNWSHVTALVLGGLLVHLFHTLLALPRIKALEAEGDKALELAPGTIESITDSLAEKLPGQLAPAIAAQVQSAVSRLVTQKASPAKKAAISGGVIAPDASASQNPSFPTETP